MLLAYYHSAWWLWLTAFVGANVLRVYFTGFCQMARILGRLGLKPGAAFGEGWAGIPVDGEARDGPGTCRGSIPTAGAVAADRRLHADGDIRAVRFC
ncbi:MAG: DUF2892 domain-containing protein [Arenicellales bacterium]